MAKIHIFMFSSLSTFEERRELGTFSPQWEGIFRTIATCFDFYYFDGESATCKRPPEQVCSAGAVLPQGVSAARVLSDINAIKREGPGASFWVAAIAKLNACWSSWNIEMYCPEPAFRTEICTLDSVLTRMSGAIKSALGKGCRVFVGPETCFHKGTFNDPTPLTMEEMMAVHEELHWITANNPMALVIPGSAYWVDIMGNVHNSLLAYSNGFNLCATTTYEKKEWTGEEKTAGKEHGAPVIGEKPYLILDWEGIKVGVQICQDSATKLPSPCDLHLILGNGTGHYVFQNRKGGLGIYVDAKGKGRLEDIYSSNDVPAGQHSYIASYAGKPHPLNF